MDKRKNGAFIAGTVTGEPEPWYEHDGVPYDRVIICSKRHSGIEDYVPVAVRDNVAASMQDGDYAVISGEYMAHGWADADGRKHLEPHVMAAAAWHGDPARGDRNEITVRGTLLHISDVRSTPGGRQIRELTVLAEAGGSGQMMPCICWEKMMPVADGLRDGCRVYLRGRLQSREYRKAREDGTYEQKTAYEVSVWRMAEGWDAAPSWGGPAGMQARGSQPGRMVGKAVAV